MQPVQLSLLSEIEARSNRSDSLAEQFASVFGFCYQSGWPDRFGEQLFAWASGAINRPIRTLSLFSGGGGLDIGFHDAGFSILNMVEIEKRYAATLQANCGRDAYLGESQATCIDIRSFTPPHDFQVDFIIGGPPCQTFSAAGRRAAGVQGTDDARGMLFAEYVRLLKQLSPQGFLFENVYGLIGAQDGKAWEEIQQAFSAVGYRIFHRILDAADYGVPQHRERLFIVGVKEGQYLFPRPTHGPDSAGQFAHYAAAEAIESVGISAADRARKVGGRYGHLLDDIPNGLNYSYFTTKMGHPTPLFGWRSKFSDFLYKADPERPVRTIKAQGGQYTGPFHWDGRRFSVAELKRLQTIPDSYHLIGGRQAAIQQIGNSVPSQLARILALSILQQLFEIELPLELPLLKPTDQLSFRKRKRSLTKRYRQKAQDAIRLLPATKAKQIEPTRQFIGRLTQGFRWEETAQADTSEGIQFHICTAVSNNRWCFELTDSNSTRVPHDTIEIVPSKQGWHLPVQTVTLSIFSAHPAAFTAAWKAFEGELSRLNFKADLVQLCDYYQYKPAFQSTMTLAKNQDDCSNRQILQQVVSGEGVRRIYSKRELARIWRVPAATIPQFAQYLKTLGYEVRNTNTNPQIPSNSYLIPYAFPTLTPLSVQLRKHL